MKRIFVRTVVTQKDQGTVSDFLSGKSGLSKVRVKDAMKKGAVWLQKKKGGLRRMRRASASLSPGDRVAFLMTKNYSPSSRSKRNASVIRNITAFGINRPVSLPGHDVR